MRYLRIIFFVLTVVFASACIENLECPTPNNRHSDGITVVGRLTRFDDCDVDTRGPKQGNESRITSYAIAIFPVVEDSGSDTGYKTGDCVFYEYHPNGDQLLFTIDRSTAIYGTNKPYAIYIFANMPNMGDFKTGSKLSDMLAKQYELEDLDIPDSGFPMVGSLGDFFSTEIDNDGQILIMSPTVGEEPPKVGLYDEGTDGLKDVTTLDVPMKALFAKMNFQIEVRPDQMIEGTAFPPQFVLKNYKLVNVPASVDFNKSTNADNDGNNASNPPDVGVLDEIVVEAGNVSASGAKKINFSFYLPENLLSPDTSWDNYNYPFGKGEGIREDDLKYRQRYKGKLLGVNQIATNIVLTGEFRDHQNHTVGVEYTIHLGKDNFSDFNIVRNTEYNNYITIRGILNSNDNENNYISLDHRVNVEHKEPNIISLRRELLLDSHFEIRPLRIKYNNDFDDTTAKYVKVEVVNAGTTSGKNNWIRLERSGGVGTSYEGKTNTNGESIYITEEGSSKGKRRYFTSDLITGGWNASRNFSLVNSTSVTVPIPASQNEEQCVWIYVDECTEEGDAVRAGTIRLTYLDSNQETITGNEKYPQIDYEINQRKLFKVTYDTNDKDNELKGRDYYIEYEEEYLHNFDANDLFGQTQQEGMMWGLNNQQLSYEHKSISFDDGLQNWLTSGSRPYYDFYITKYDEQDAADSEGILHSYNGFEFSQSIIDVMNGDKGSLNNDSSDDIDVLPLNQIPRSAVEYCYNKNKRNADGTISNVYWYLPAIDELEDIIVSSYYDIESKTYARFEDFQNKFYWSSQPAFIRNFAYYQGLWDSRDSWGAMYIDNVNYARATKVNYLGKDEYDYAKSGINIQKDDNGNDVYYNASHYVYGGLGGTRSYGPADGTVKIDNRITLTLKELKDQIQEGYISRTDMARVRCVRKK